MVVISFLIFYNDLSYALFFCKLFVLLEFSDYYKNFPSRNSDQRNTTSQSNINPPKIKRIVDGVTFIYRGKGKQHVIQGTMWKSNQKNVCSLKSKPLSRKVILSILIERLKAFMTSVQQLKCCGF